MVLEAGELGAWGDGKVLESMELPTLTSWLVLVVLQWLKVNVSSPLGNMVFLLPWWLSGGLLHVWDPAISLIGSWKVPFLAVFLLPLGVLWIATWSCDCVAVKFRT